MWHSVDEPYENKDHWVLERPPVSGGRSFFVAWHAEKEARPLRLADPWEAGALWRLPPRSAGGHDRLRDALKEETMVAQCPECEAEVKAAEPVQLGEIMVCPDCGSELEVTTLEPLALAIAPREEEDWGE